MLRSGCGAQVLVDRFAADAERAGQYGLRFPCADPLTQLVHLIIGKGTFAAAVGTGPPTGGVSGCVSCTERRHVAARLGVDENEGTS